MYCLPEESLTIQPISTYFTGRLLRLRTSICGARASLPEITRRALHRLHRRIGELQKGEFRVVLAPPWRR